MVHEVSVDEHTAGHADGPRWLLGGPGGLQVWASGFHLMVRATLLIARDGRTGPILLINLALVGTSCEGAAMNWALGLLSEGGPGFYVLRAI